MPAHFGSAKSPTSLQDSHDEVMLLLRLMELRARCRWPTAPRRPLADESTPAPSAGAELIVAEALKDDPRPLHVAFLGPLTDMASALAAGARDRAARTWVIWIGGGHWPVGGREYNLSNDIAAANVVARVGLEIWQIPMPVYRRMAVSYAELHERVAQGAIGSYLVEQLIDGTRAWSGPDRAPLARRFAGDRRDDVPECGEAEWVPGPEFSPLMTYVHTGRNRRSSSTGTSTSASSWRTCSPSWPNLPGRPGARNVHLRLHGASALRRVGADRGFVHLRAPAWRVRKHEVPLPRWSAG